MISIQVLGEQVAPANAGRISSLWAWALGGRRRALHWAGSITLLLDMNQSKELETTIVVVETGQVLGNLRWNMQRWSASSWFGGPDSSTTTRRANCA